MAALRWYQKKAVEIFGTLPEPRRYFLPWDMGAGKTLGAISIAKAYNRQKVLIIAPALIRENWRRELQTHWPEAELGIIEWGRKRKLPEEKDAERTRAYSAPVQVVSYDLLKEIDPFGWDMIIVDEFHNLRAPRSAQSKNVLKIFQANPGAWAVGLSGTPIPNEAKQLWNPVDIFFPNRWGQRTNVGSEAWNFLWKYCETEQNQHGRSFFGLKQDMRGELEAAFAEISFRIVQKDFAEFLPPLFVKPMYFDQKPDPVKIALDWYDSVKDECAHVGIYTHLRQTARDIAAALEKRFADTVPFFIDGSVSTPVRNDLLVTAAKMDRSVIVGTTHALKEGISLSFQKTALVVEWTTAVDEVVQFIARFARQDSVGNTPTLVQFVVGPSDESRCDILRARMDSINSVIKASKTSEVAAEVFVEREMTDDEFQAELNRLVQSQEKRSNLWAPTEDDEDDDND
jgi:superfamily II DNA or RNA helicase